MNPVSEIIEQDASKVCYHAENEYIREVKEKPQNIEKILRLYTLMCKRFFEDMNDLKRGHFIAGPNKTSKTQIIKIVDVKIDAGYSSYLYTTKYYSIFLKILPYKGWEVKSSAPDMLYNLVQNMEFTYDTIMSIITKEHKIKKEDMKSLNNMYQMYKEMIMTNPCSEIEL